MPREMKLRSEKGKHCLKKKEFEELWKPNRNVVRQMKWKAAAIQLTNC